MTQHSKDNLYYDLCVVGAGPAGIMLALEFARANPAKSVAIIEYGLGQVKNELDDSIEIKNRVNHHDPYECTNKGLGGTSATWGGRCVMYDEVDFIDRAILKGGCTWSMDVMKEIKPFMDRTARYFECGRPVFNLEELPGIAKGPIAEHFIAGAILSDTALERWSMPTRFGRRYAKELSGCRNITVMTGFEARNFSKPDKSGHVPILSIRSTATDRKIMNIEAAHFVLAAGTQETTRILLRNKQLFNNLDRVPPALGRYYQGHLSGKIASVKFKGDPRKTDFGFLRDSDGTYLRRRFQFSAGFLEANNLLNIAIWLDNPLYYNPKHRSGAMSFMYLAMLMPFLGRKLAPPAIAHSITSGRKTAISKHIGNILRGLPGSLTIPASIFFRRYCSRRKLPGVFLYSPQNRYALHFHAEQIPGWSNRMELSADGETLQIDYNLSDPEIDSVIQLHNALDVELRAMGCGELEYWFAEDDIRESIRNMSRDGIHQSGTVRISDSPSMGVVNSDLLLWGTSNVHVCSSAVFPTSGQANPTFLLGAFALRLARHLSTCSAKSTVSASKDVSSVV